MPPTDTPDNPDTVASHTLAYLRSHGKKLDLILETLTRQGERLGRLERDLGESRRDIIEIKSDIALLENKVLTSQTEVLTILHRLDQSAARPVEPFEPVTPTPAGSRG